VRSVAGRNSGRVAGIPATSSDGRTFTARAATARRRCPYPRRTPPSTGRSLGRRPAPSWLPPRPSASCLGCSAYPDPSAHRSLSWPPRTSLRGGQSAHAAAERPDAVGRTLTSQRFLSRMYRRSRSVSPSILALATSHLPAWWPRCSCRCREARCGWPDANDGSQQGHVG